MRLPFFQAQSTSRVCWSVGIHENENVMRSPYPNARPCRRERLPFFYHQHGCAYNRWLYTPAGRKWQLALGKTCSVVLVGGLEFFCDRHSEDQRCSLAAANWHGSSGHPGHPRLYICICGAAFVILLLDEDIQIDTGMVSGNKEKPTVLQCSLHVLSSYPACPVSQTRSSMPQARDVIR